MANTGFILRDETSSIYFFFTLRNNVIVFQAPGRQFKGPENNLYKHRPLSLIPGTAMGGLGAPKHQTCQASINRLSIAWGSPMHCYFFLKEIYIDIHIYIYVLYVLYVFDSTWNRNNLNAKRTMWST